MTLIDQIFNDVVTPYLEPRIKKSSLKAVKGYVKGVQIARKIAITAYGIGAASAIAVTGVILMIVAVIGLLPIDPRTALVSLLVLGAVLTIASAIIAYLGFNQKQWLEMSKSNEMLDAVLKPWPTAYSVPDPRAVLGFQNASQTYDADRNYDVNRKLATSRANRTPASAAHDSINAHLPTATYPSMTTPDAAFATRSIDTTSLLRP